MSQPRFCVAVAARISIFEKTSRAVFDFCRSGVGGGGRGSVDDGGREWRAFTVSNAKVKMYGYVGHKGQNAGTHVGTTRRRFPTSGPSSCSSPSRIPRARADRRAPCRRFVSRLVAAAAAASAAAAAAALASAARSSKPVVTRGDKHRGLNHQPARDQDNRRAGSGRGGGMRMRRGGRGEGGV